GVAAILLALPLLTGGAALVAFGRHPFAASLDRVDTEGYAVVVPDVDDLLRRNASFVQGLDASLRVEARIGTAPAFVGLAPRAALLRYLDGVPYASVRQ